MDRPIVFASDYGAGTEWVGTCHAVIASLAPAARIIDLVHTLPRFDPAAAGLVLREAMPFTPVCIAVLVVDPGVGTERRALACATGRGDVLIGPDNGLLPLASERIGAVTAARLLDPVALGLAPASSTFHGRDLFSPIAARLVLGQPFEDLAPSVDVGSLVQARTPLLDVARERIESEVIDVDTFGNVRLSARTDALAASGLDASSMLHASTPSGELLVRRASTFRDIEAGQVGVIVDSFGWLSLCIPSGSAAAKLGLTRGSRVVMTQSTSEDKMM